MTPSAVNERIRSRAPRLAAVLAAVIAFAACTSSAAPSPSTVVTAATVTPVVTASVDPSPTPSPTPSPSAAIVRVTPIPGAPDSKTVVQVVAANSKWVPTTLSAPAGKVWHVKIDNQDNKGNDFVGFGHNFTVASGRLFAERIFQTPKFDYGTHTFDIPALPAGSYLFSCTLHDTMNGTLTIK